MTSPNSPSTASTQGLRPFRCSDGARERGDPMVGTAPPAKRWLLIELEGRWLPTAIDSLGLRPEVRTHLSSLVSASKARVMLIRKVGRRPSGPHRKWCVIDDPATAAGPVLTWGTWQVGGELVAAGQVLAAQAAAAKVAKASGTPAPEVSPPSSPELLLVCTHGKHDVCCATRGRPVAAALDQRWPDETWECSHTGGDRFAANALVLPDGACYGGLDPDVAVTVIAEHYRASPDTAYLRGRTGSPPAEQAAIVAAHRHHPAARWGSFTVDDIMSDGGQHVVRVTGDMGSFEVPVTEHVREPHQLTCAATTTNRSTVPVAGEIRRLQ